MDIPIPNRDCSLRIAGGGGKVETALYHMYHMYHKPTDTSYLSPQFPTHWLQDPEESFSCMQ